MYIKKKKRALRFKKKQGLLRWGGKKNGPAFFFSIILSYALARTNLPKQA